MVNESTIATDGIWKILAQIPDPEVPGLSLSDLGIIRDVKLIDDMVAIDITPTYTGCPAHDVIMQTIRMELAAHGYKQVTLKQVLSPAWTTDWISKEGKEKLLAYGIAPPNPVQQFCHQTLFAVDEIVACPKCGSIHTKGISEFGSTPCKSLYQCNDCLEPFDYFKCH